MTQDIIYRARARAQQLQKMRTDPRCVRAIGFLVAKGLLISPGIVPQPSIKVPLVDALWVGEHIEPRVLEVLPAAVLHFPRSFLRPPEMPEDLAKIIGILKHGDQLGPDFRGVPFERLLRWVNTPLADKRTRSLRDRRVVRTFRIRPDLLKKLSARAALNSSTNTDVLERALEAFFSQAEV